MTDKMLIELAAKIQNHAYTWGWSEMEILESGQKIDPYENTSLGLFPAQPSYIFKIITDMGDVTETSRDPWIIIVFTKDGDYVKIGNWLHKPMNVDSDGNPVVKNVYKLDDAQKPYKTHGFN